MTIAPDRNSPDGMAAPKNPRGGRKPRTPGVVADEKVTIRLTGPEHEQFATAALAAGHRMPRTKEHPEPRGAVGAWLRSLGLAALSLAKDPPDGDPHRLERRHHWGAARAG